MNIPELPSNSTGFDHTLARLQTLSLSSPHSDLSLTSMSASRSSSDSPQSQCALSAPFSMSYRRPSKDLDGVPTIIDTFAPRPLGYDLSPTSSASSDFDSHSSHISFPRSSYEAFVATRSRVVRLYNLPRLPEAFLSAVFLPQSQFRGSIPAPVTMWTLREEYGGLPRPDSVWAVYKTHEEAATALALSGPVLSVTTALESDLEPFHKLRRFVLTSSPPISHASRSSATVSLPQLRVSSSHPDLQASRIVSDRISMDHGDYTLSSNPPNPRTSFRLGDWICSSPKCAAHNFGRNLACIGCGCPRSSGGTAPPQHQQTYPPTRTLTSPRFASFPPHSSSLPAPTQLATPAPQQQQPMYTYSQPQQPLHPTQQPQPQQQQHAFAQPPPKSAHPLLTPSGRAFAVGGKVQNISSDPLAPCIMYWPDNEPFPEQGQIRPNGVVGVPCSQQPPILNTGNRGPISHQPGDWVCQKCNYLNWRRRKVCQTCLPYAEGNGDSISAAVQAERIALLTSVLAQTQQHAAAGPQLASEAPRSHSMTPPQQRRPFIDVSPPQTHAPVHRSHSHFELGAQYTNSHPIYQTSARRQPSPLYSTGPDFHQLPVHAPAPLLPSFLQDIVQSPALSPTSTSSADLSFEEYEEMTSTKPTFPRARTHSGDDSATSSPIGNIWRLDGEESKSLSAFALPNHQDLMGTGRRNSREGIHLQLVNS
ncbi:hypothetical protein Hypma_009234 [Hypsizygus marmoreus]|uniref:RanBP2-type domain-containing protein n=1 Tax=Hypsizygus marmoreus TaxID=39966 RepID=A0A369JQA5_HYPMA|nr:hypothetical protein Hypma_009234 [Hypsizygus marmoreus]